MHLRRFILEALAVVALLPACQEDDIPTALPRLKTLSVQETSIVIPPGETAQLHFSVTDPDFEFITDPGSSLFPLRLRREDGSSPEQFVIESVSKEKVSGVYTAVIRDKGAGEGYSLRVVLSFVSGLGGGNLSYIDSSIILIACRGNGTEPPSPAEKLLIDTGLPVVVVNTASPVTSKTEFVAGTVKIQAAGGYEGLPEMACEMRGRGNTTWTWPKKPYLLRLESKQKIFGLPKHRRWVLLANFMDRTLMRNLVSMKVASLTKLAWSPHCVPVELFLNGSHLGSYLLIEQVRVDGDRVDITEMTPTDNSGEAVTGGYLLELDFHYDNPVQWKDSHGGGIPFAVKYPDEDDLTPQQLAYIKGYISEAAGAIYGSNFKDPNSGYAKYIDVDSFVDYWIVFEVMGNHELGNPGSVFMHKDRGGKLVAGPVWDFDWGVLSYRTSPRAKTGLVNGKAIWYARLFEDPAFKAKVGARFKELLPELEKIPAYMEQCRRLLSTSAAVNFSMWNPAEDASQNGGSIINGDENMTFDDAVDRLISIYEERLTVIPKNL